MSDEERDRGQIADRNITLVYSEGQQSSGLRHKKIEEQLADVQKQIAGLPPGGVLIRLTRKPDPTHGDGI